MNQNNHYKPHRTNNRNNFSSNRHHTFNTHPSQPQSQSHTHFNPHSLSTNQQIRSRKRRFEAHNDQTNNPNTTNRHRHTYTNHQPPSKRIRYNQNTTINSTNNTRPQFREQKNRNNTKKKKIEMEEDFHRITQRMRQIDIGKTTPEYKNYISLIPKHKRQYNHPKTPNARRKMPNKWWKKAVNDWRKLLHQFDDDKIKILNIKNTNSPQKDKENINTNKLQNFSCEKCSKEFAKFDAWQNHRETCDGKQYKNTKNEIVANNENISIKSTNKNDIENDSDIENKNIKHEDSDIENEIKDTNQDLDEESKLLMSLNDILDDDDIGLF